jgi:hypothetical protein
MGPLYRHERTRGLGKRPVRIEAAIGARVTYRLTRQLPDRRRQADVI